MKNFLAKVAANTNGAGVLLGLLIAWALPVQAEQKIKYSDYEIHYIGLTSSELKPEVAKLYNIPRSRSLGYLNISVLKTRNETLPKPTGAEISGKVYNLIGQSRTLNFREIKEAGAVYYITTFEFDDGDMYRFEIQTTPKDSGEPLDVKFSQRFYAGN